MLQELAVIFNTNEKKSEIVPEARGRMFDSQVSHFLIFIFRMPSDDRSDQKAALGHDVGHGGENGEKGGEKTGRNGQFGKFYR